MQFTVLSPNDSPLKENKSDMTASNFGGNREVSNTADAKDYTKRTGNAPNKKENPVEDTSRDTDEMTDPKARKREFSRREETSNVQSSNEADFITKSDSDKRPRMDEGSDAVQVPETHAVKRHRKHNQWHFEGEIR